MANRDPHILILTNPEDLHSFVAAEALRRKGVRVSLWHGSDFPSRQVGSFWANDETSQWEVLGPELELVGSALSAVWLRRPGDPVLSDDIDPADRQFALRECRAFLNGLYRRVGAEAFWVNPLPSFGRANLKIEQIRSASRAGIKIPRTLFSNDPRRIREFVGAMSGRVIYKSFYPASWQKTDGVAVLFSSPIEERDLPEDSILQSTPGIFQEAVPKAYELRVTAMGAHLFAAKLDSQAVPSARLDFRAATSPVPIEPVELPTSLGRACRRVMRDLGIVFGCFDLIVTPQGEYVFLEVNEMGAFIWIEEQDPQFKLVDAFCEFLIQGSPDFRWDRSLATVDLLDVYATALYEMRSVATQNHVGRTPDAVRDDD